MVVMVETQVENSLSLLLSFVICTFVAVRLALPLHLNFGACDYDNVVFDRSAKGVTIVVKFSHHAHDIMMPTQLRVAVVQFAPKVSARFLGDENSNYNRTSSTSSAKCKPT
jgi:hypothetical protein